MQLDQTNESQHDEVIPASAKVEEAIGLPVEHDEGRIIRHAQVLERQAGNHRQHQMKQRRREGEQVEHDDRLDDVARVESARVPEHEVLQRKADGDHLLNALQEPS